MRQKFELKVHLRKGEKGQPGSQIALLKLLFLYRSNSRKRTGFSWHHMSELRHVSLVDEVTFSVWISAAADVLAVKEQMSNADNCYITKLKT